MDIEFYKNLCRACDKVLKSEKSNFVTICIPWLHVLNVHPTALKKYRVLERRSFWLNVKMYLYSAVSFAINLFSPKLISEQEVEIKNRQNIDLLIVSHFINQNAKGESLDFYFGNLADDLLKEGIHAEYLLLNHTKLSATTLAKSWGDYCAPRHFFATRLSIILEIALVGQLIKQSFQLRKRAWQEQNGFDKRVLKQAAHEALSRESIAALRFAKQMETLLEKLSPRAIITTLEGHSFERICYHVAKSSAKNIKCLGYQHAIMFPHQHGLQRGLDRQYDPDLILTSGEQTISEFLRGSFDKSLKVINIGTYKYDTAPRYMISKKLETRSNCLLLPDGNIDDCMLICEFGVHAAQNIPNTNFIIRLHPLLGIEDLISNNSIFRNLPSNICFSSEKDITQDFAKSRWVLYRGSGAAIHAGMAACRPIYLSLGEDICFDPLYKLERKHPTISDTIKLQDIIIDDMGLSEAKFIEEMMDIRAFCASYFTPINITRLTAELQDLS